MFLKHHTQVEGVYVRIQKLGIDTTLCVYIRMHLPRNYFNEIYSQNSRPVKYKRYIQLNLKH